MYVNKDSMETFQLNEYANIGILHFDDQKVEYTFYAQIL